MVSSKIITDQHYATPFSVENNFSLYSITTLTCTHYQSHLNYNNGLKNFISASNSQSIRIVIPPQKIFDLWQYWQ